MNKAVNINQNVIFYWVAIGLSVYSAVAGLEKSYLYCPVKVFSSSQVA